jgi:hypothetical protein
MQVSLFREVVTNVSRSNLTYHLVALSNADKNYKSVWQYNRSLIFAAVHFPRIFNQHVSLFPNGGNDAIRSTLMSIISIIP